MRLSSARRLLPWAPVALRLSLGVIFIAHGGQRLFGVWNGPGLSATIDFFNTTFGIPGYLLLLAVVTEFFGGIAVIIGLLTRLASVAFAIEMIVAIVATHVADGVFPNWSLTSGQSYGYEFNLALLGMAVALFLSGPGRLALDHVLGFEDD